MVRGHLRPGVELRAFYRHTCFELLRKSAESRGGAPSKASFRGSLGLGCSMTP